MSGEFSNELLNLLVAGLIVAAIALPFGIAAWFIIRRTPQPLLPHWRQWWAPWSCFEVIFAVVVVMMLIPMTINSGLEKADSNSNTQVTSTPSAEISEEPAASDAGQQKDQTGRIRQLWAGVLAFPLQLTILLGVCRIVYPQWWFIARPGLAPQILLAIIVWAILTLVVHAANISVNLLFTVFDWHPDAHPLGKLGGQSLLVSVLFVVHACIAAPIIEEFVFRGVILAWLMGSEKKKSSRDVPARLRPFFIALLGLLFALSSERMGAIAFSTILVMSLPLVGSIFRRKRRTATAIFSSAGCFAAIHSSIWPSPIALFFLGLGLGWLAVRTRSIVAPTIVHGLFNAVSTIIVLRGSG